MYGSDIYKDPLAFDQLESAMSIALNKLIHSSHVHRSEEAHGVFLFQTSIH